MATKKRRLEDLYRRGRELTIDDGTGDPVEVWLQKLNPLEHEKSIRKAGAAKARMLMAGRNPDSEEYQEAYNDALSLGNREALMDYLISEDLMRARDAFEAELAFQDEWKNDGYLQGLRDAWNDEDDPLLERYAKDPEDSDARRVFLELKRFDDIVQEKVDAEAIRLRRDLEELSEDDLADRVVGKFISLRGNLAWVREYKRCEVFFTTRDPSDKKTYYFPDREAVDALAPEVFRQISSAYEELTVDPQEGKDSPRTETSSPSSEPPNEVATEGPSGLTVVTP